MVEVREETDESRGSGDARPSNGGTAAPAVPILVRGGYRKLI